MKTEDLKSKTPLAYSECLKLTKQGYSPKETPALVVESSNECPYETKYIFGDSEAWLLTREEAEDFLEQKKKYQKSKGIIPKFEEGQDAFYLLGYSIHQGEIVKILHEDVDTEIFPNKKVLYKYQLKGSNVPIPEKFLFGNVDSLIEFLKKNIVREKG